MRLRALFAAAVVLAAGCFALGLWVGREPPSRASVTVAERDAGAVEPRLVFDPSSIRLLPDAALELKPPTAFDGGAFDESGESHPALGR